MSNLAQNGPPEKPYDLGFSLLMSETFLREAAAEVGTVKVGFPSTADSVTARVAIDSCATSVGALGTAFPSVSEIVADLYWDAVEQLEKVGLDFGVLLEYHNDRDGEVGA